MKLTAAGHDIFTAVAKEWNDNQRSAVIRKGPASRKLITDGLIMPVENDTMLTLTDAGIALADDMGLLTSMHAEEIRQSFTLGETIMVEIDGIPTGEYVYVETGSVYVYLSDETGLQQHAVKINAFYRGWDGDKVHKFTVTQEALPSGHVFYATCSHGYTTGFHAERNDARDVALGHGAVSRPLHSSWPIDTRVEVKGEMATVVQVRGAAAMIKLDTPDKRDGSHITVPVSSLAVIAEATPAPFRTSGKVKSTSRARRYRKGA